MTVSLRPEIERFVAEKVRAGEYGSAEEAVNGLLAQVIGRNGNASATLGGVRNGIPVFAVPGGSATFGPDEVRRGKDEPE